MNLSWKIGSAFGIPVRLHFTMLLLPFLMYDGRVFGDSFGFLIWLGFVALIFGSVLMHELGHALTARRYGIDTQDIILTPIGGIARIVKMPETPKQEIAIALAGPLVSLLLALSAFALATPITLFSNSLAVARGITFLIYINGVLGLFNLIPALPMDGGRVLRGILALRRDHLSATRIAVKVGRTLAVLGAIGAILWFENKMNILLVAGFIYVMAGNELRHAEIKAVRERMAREAARAGSPGSRQPWPWNVYVHRAEETSSAVVDNDWREPQAAAPPSASRSRDSKEEWSSDNSGSDQRDVLVVKGGKVEILSRKDPEKK